MADERSNIARPAGPLANLNDPGESFKNPLQVEFIRYLVRLIGQGFDKAILRDRTSPYFMLVSPGGKSYRVSVDDNGTLRADYVRG